MRDNCTIPMWKEMLEQFLVTLHPSDKCDMELDWRCSVDERLL
jgi:hypothetical protein